MEAVPGFVVHSVPLTAKLKLTIFRLVSVLLHLKKTSSGPRFDAVLEYYRKMSRVPNVEYVSLDISRRISPEQLTDLTSSIVNLALYCSNALLSGGLLTLKE